MLQYAKEKLQKLKQAYFGKNILKALSFGVLGILIFCFLQNIFIPKRFPYDKSNDAGKLKYYYNELKNNIDVLILGTSHSSRGILPMEMYEAFGIKSYNLSTSVQPIEASYFTLFEAIKDHTPKVVILDASNLYINDEDPSRWKTALDEMKIGKNKKNLAQEYLKKYTETGESIFELLFPLLGYHSRWKELSKQDISFYNINKTSFGKGGMMCTGIWGSVSIDEMNSIANGLLQNTEMSTYGYNMNEYSERLEENIIYSTNISSENIEWLLKIKDLCDKYKIQLVMVKVPCVYSPQSYNSAWTIQKSEMMHNICNEYGITYYDILYDTDINFDCAKDSYDGGMHLNFYGAQKVSINLANYLKQHYELSFENNEQWDTDLIHYQKVRKIVLLELEQDFNTYVAKLIDEYKDNYIFIVASDDMSCGLNETDINLLRNLGLQMDFSNALQKSYIAVIENGKVTYESLSNRTLNYTGKCSNSDIIYELYSSGWWTNPGSSIKLDGFEFGLNSRGLNIVVYDDKRNLVLDSVGFDTCAEYHIAIRNNEMVNLLEQEFEQYIMEVEDR